MFFKPAPLGFALGLLLVGGPALLANTSFPRSIVPVEQPASAQTAQPPNVYGRIVRTTLTSSELAAAMHFDIALKLRNKDELDARIVRGEILSRAELEPYLPAAVDYARIRAWLVAQGFAITLDASTRHAIFAQGSNARVAAAFGVTLARVATPDGEFTSAVTAPALPDEIAGAVAGIRGLQPHLLRHPRSTQRPLQLEANSYHLITPAAVTAAYAAPSNFTGSGQAIAVIGDSSAANSDLTTFWSQCGVAQSTGNISVVNVGAGPGSDTTNKFEVSMDLEWTSGTAPGAQVRLYATPYPMDSNSEAAAYTQILNDLPSNPSIHEVTESYGGNEEPFEFDQGDTALPLLAAQGVSCFAASGDGGSNPDTDPTKNSYNSADPLAVSYPSSDPYMTAVGGTTLHFPQSLNGQPVFPEVAWSVGATGSNGTGGGSSTLFSRPSWQVATGLPAGNMRCIPDVSALADTGSGGTDMSPLVYEGGNAYGGGGTSLSSPIWAGICALINQARANAGQGPVGLLTPKLYQVAGTSSITDITIGANGEYQAGVGYDLCTGLGTPSVANLIAFLTTGQIAPSITTQPVSQTVTIGSAVTFAAAATGMPTPTFQWQKDHVNIGGATSSSYAIASVAASDAGTYALVASNSAGLATSNGAVLTVNPAPVAPSITTQPASQTVAEGQVATFTVTAAGDSPLTYQWRLNSSNLSGATSNTLTISPVSPGNAGNYDVVVTNGAGSVTSTEASLSVLLSAPAISIVSPVRQVLTPGQALNLTITTSPTNGDSGPVSVQWYHNGLAVSGANLDTFTAAAAAITDSGWYIAVATDTAGSRRSAPLFVIVAPDSTHVLGWGENGVGQTTPPAGLVDAVAVSAGGSFNVALKRDGTVVAWGYNSNSQTAVPSGLDNVVAVSAGDSHALALRADGTVVSWGDYAAGSIPPGLADVVAVSAGENYSLAVKVDGTVVAWGQDFDGDTDAPAGLSNVIAVAAGGARSVALRADGTVVAWGQNDSGQSTVPAGLTDVVAISAGRSFSVALKSDGSLVAWGENSYGELSLPSGPAIAISSGWYHTVDLRSNGTVGAGGYNGSGQTSVPANLANVFGIAAGDSYSLALYDAGADSAPVIASSPANQTVAETQAVSFSVSVAGTSPLSYQWRKNGAPIAGANNPTYSIAATSLGDAGSYDAVVTNYLGSATSAAATLMVNPIPVVTMAGPYRQVLTPGQGIALSATATGTGNLSYQWFHNGLAIAGATTSSLAVVSATWADRGWYMVEATDDIGTRRSAAQFVFVAPATTQVAGWGFDGISPANGAITKIPAGLTDAVELKAGEDAYGLALRRDGSVVGWGSNFFGELGIPQGLTDVVAIAAGDVHALAVKSDGTVVAWGNNTASQLNVPAGLGGVVAVAAGTQHSLALKSDGTVVGWGDNTVGELNLGGYKNVVAIAASGSYSVALLADGTVVSAGNNGIAADHAAAISAGHYGGEVLLRDGTVLSGYAPAGAIPRPAGLTNVVGIGAGYSHYLALKSDGTVVAWGDNYWGETNVPYGLDHVLEASAGEFFSLVLRDPSSDRAPAFTSSPASQSVVELGSVTLSVDVTGGGPFDFQWRHNGANLSGANARTYTIASASPADAGNYDVVVSNSAGTSTSASAALTVLPLPVVSLTTASRVVVAPSGAIHLGVSAIGTGSLTYQWYRNGLPVTAATTPDYVVSHSGIQDAGYYYVDVTDSIGTRRSAPQYVLVSRPGSTLVVWGDNNNGQVNALPSGLTNVAAVSANLYNGLALLADGTVVQWSPYLPTNPNTGGYPSPSSFPAGLGHVVAVAAGSYHSLALKDDGTVVAWGDNSYGQCSIPSGLQNVVAISAAGYRSLALTSSGTVYSWGENYYAENNIPVGLANVIGIAAGYEYSLALKTDGTVVGWGSAPGGAVGVPAGLSHVAAIAASDYFAIALKSDGTVMGWGNGANQTVPAGLSGVTTIACNGTYALARISDGSLVAWNDNAYDASASAAYVSAAVSNAYAIAIGRYYCLALCDPAPAITGQPASHNATYGSDVVLSVTAGGTGPFTYQWYKDGTAIAGATTSELHLSGLTYGDAGTYSAQVTNAAGTTTSAEATLKVEIATTDINGDGKVDLLWENTAGVDRAIWYLDGTDIAGFDYLAGVPSEWKIVGTADFDSDGKTDILWEDTLTGDRSVWLMSGTSILDFPYLAWVDPSWHIAAVGDFNGDGKPDILWENAESGGVDRAIWFLDGTNILGFGYLAGIPPEWKIVGTGDFNGDGQTDIVWEDTTTGDRSIWLMNGASISSFAYVANVDPAWHIAMVADFDGDGQPDLLWENRTTGDRAIWIMDGTTHASSVYLAYVDPVWHIAP